jgi:hypothetical protein
MKLFAPTFLVILACASYGQQLTGSLSGTVYDQSGAVVPKADVTMKNEASNDIRHSVSNNDGYFHFAAVPPGSYTVTVTASGFQAWSATGIAFSQGDNRTLPTISLQVGSTSQNVQVITEAEAIAPTDTGEVAATLNAQMVNDIAIQGRDAGELLKIMPGMAFTNGLSQGSGFTDRVVGSNSGPVGAYSSNGQQPNGSMSYMLDGANLVDPGNQGTQIANINQDMTSEVKVLMSGYDAAYAKGPVVFEAYGKSGGARFHGEGYLYARNNIFNSNESYYQSLGNKKVDAYEYYPGGNIGGPILLPFTHFNRGRDKLFFWVGYEYMRQQPAGQLWQTSVPTAGERGGDFSPASLAAIKAVTPSSGAGIYNQPCLTAGGSCGTLSFPDGQIPPSMMDPNALALLNLYPKPNVDPATHGGYNYNYLDQSPQNRWELTEKIDYSINDKTKLTVSYAFQNEKDLHPVQTWWAPAFSLPYASPLVAPTTSNVVMANVTHIFSSTLTNETVFTYARYINPLTPVNPKAIDPSNIGFNVPGLFGVKETQIPNVISWSGNQFMGGWDQQSVFGGTFNGGAFGGLKKDPAIYDNLSKVAGTHTMKAGFYWDTNENVQSSGNQLNGTYDFETYGGTTTGNLFADLILGRSAGYNQANIVPVDDLKFHQYSFYVQDSWKAGRRLTLNYGVRLDHMGQWYPATSEGASVFSLGNYLSNPSATNAGLLWHSVDSSIPISGFKSPAFYYEPRVGVAYDIFGDGKTVLRGGFAVFRYQLAYNLTSGPAELPEGAINYSGPGAFTSLAAISSFNVPSSNSAANCGTGCSISPLLAGDGKTPYTENYNISLSRALPGRVVAEFSYVGNRSRDGLFAGGAFDNLNAVPIGAFFKPDPLTGVVNPAYNIPNAGDYRPFQTYGDIDVSKHGSYANFNSFQASAKKTAGPVSMFVNYTFGKVLGIRDNYSGNGSSAGSTVDPFNMQNNYGVLGYNHSQIFNAAYVYNLPKPIHGNRMLEGVVNGWQLSGTTSWQTGAPIQPNTSGTLNATWGQIQVPGAAAGTYEGVGTASYLGSNASLLALVPQLVCNPGANLKSGQYFNPSCFAPPAFGSNGTTVWPNIHGPAYFNSDLTLSKSFKLTETQKVQFRMSAFNFLNHPNPQFGLGGNNDISLSFVGPNNLLSQANTNSQTTGKPLHTTGDRLVEFAVKYYF